MDKLTEIIKRLVERYPLIVGIILILAHLIKEYGTNKQTYNEQDIDNNNSTNEFVSPVEMVEKSKR